MDNRDQVFTPSHIVKYMLDLACYKGNMYGKKVIENSCGEGNILCVIVHRYIEGLKDYDLAYIKRGLEQDIVGYDIDKYCCEATLQKLNEVASTYGITHVKWNIQCKDALLDGDKDQYDFVIGNPPYISYRSMDADTREVLRNKFDSCKIGAFDYCYAFIERSLVSLKQDGKMVYLIPSSIFKNVHGKELRGIMIRHLEEIHDYTSQKLFGKVLTSSALIVCKKDSAATSIAYRNIAQNTLLNVNKDHLIDKWMFVEEGSTQEKRGRFGDFFNASIVIATLCNSAFVISKYEESDGYIKKDGKLIELTVTRKAVSPRQLRNGATERIIFPYTYDSAGRLIRYSEDSFCKEFPHAAKYLMDHKQRLLARDADKQALWFEYGRSQALGRINQEKLLLSTIVTGQVEVYDVEENDVPYAGIIITKKHGTPLGVARKILESDAFLHYVQAIGTYANGHSIRITPKDIENFEFNAKMLELN